MDPQTVERELKLTPEDPRLLDVLWEAPALGPFVPVRRVRERQRSAFFDTRTDALKAARLAFRRRTIEGETLAVWTLKGEGSTQGGVATRPEIEVWLDEDMPPALALSTLGQAARARGAVALAETLADALRGSPPVLARPFLELEAERRLVELHVPAHGWRVGLALDRVTLPLDPAYLDVEIEAELWAGEEAVLEAIRAAIEQLGTVRASVGTKLSRAMAHLVSSR